MDTPKQRLVIHVPPSWDMKEATARWEDIAPPPLDPGHMPSMELLNHYLNAVAAGFPWSDRLAVEITAIIQQSRPDVNVVSVDFDTNTLRVDIKVEPK